MTMEWTQLLKDLGIFSIAITAIGFVARAVFNHSLDLLSKKEVIKFSKLHEERAQIVKNLYEKLIKIRKSMNRFMIFYGPEGPNLEEGKTAYSNLVNFIDYFDNNQIFFSEKICSSIEEIRSNYMDAYTGFISYESFRGQFKHDKEISTKDFDSKNKAWDKISKMLPLLERELVNEFRRILGVLE